VRTSRGDCIPRGILKIGKTSSNLVQKSIRKQRGEKVKTITTFLSKMGGVRDEESSDRKTTVHQRNGFGGGRELVKKM